MALARVWTQGKPLIRVVGTVAVTACVSDVACQYIIATKGFQEGPEVFTWDRARTGRMVLTAAAATGPLSLGWNHGIEKLVPGKAYGAIGKKMTLNFLFGPIMSSIQFGTITLLAGGSFSDAGHKIAKDGPTTWVAGMFLWPIVGFVNLRFVPVNYRPIVSSMVGAFWGIFVSMQANKPTDASIEDVLKSGRVATAPAKAPGGA